MKRNVIGFVGPQALSSTLRGSQVKPALKNLRNYVEDRIENKFDAVANLALADTGTVHVRFANDPDPEENAELLRYAEECVRDFRVEV
jgi:hypothetical protein